MANWFSIVSQDISKIPDAILHYETELDKASAEVKLHGNIEKQSIFELGSWKYWSRNHFRNL